jgi:ABC-2 type transport system ATP-binding protein
MSVLIALDGLTKKFGDLVAVDNVTMTVSRGEVLGFLGPNGAGKSTTMKIVAGFLEPTSGRAEVCGFDVVRDPVAVKRRMGYLPEGAPTYGEMTPQSYLGFIAAIRGYDGAERRRRVAAAVEKLALEQVLRQPIETLSKGFKRRVGLAQAILHDPEVLVMDEPTDGLDPNQKRHVRRLIKDMSADKAIVISTHILEEVDAVCTRAVIIAAGRLLADGTPQELQARARYHNALSLLVAVEKVDAAEREIATLGGVDSVERIARKDGRIALRIMHGGGVKTADVDAALRPRGIAIDEITVERGALDDVFHDITANLAQRENPYA